MGSSSYSSVNFKQSRYVSGGITEVGPIGLEWWSRFNFPTDISDIIYTVTNITAGKIHMIANHFYDDPGLWWVIAQYNNILDAYDEIVPGRVLYIPTKDRVQLLLTQKIGGIPPARGNENILPPVVL